MGAWSSDPVILGNSMSDSAQGEMAMRHHTQMHLAREGLSDEGVEANKDPKHFLVEKAVEFCITNLGTQ